jgi:hypothetical protein
MRARVRAHFSMHTFNAPDSGFTKVSQHADKYRIGTGVWGSPWGGYGSAGKLTYTFRLNNAYTHKIVISFGQKRHSLVFPSPNFRRYLSEMRWRTASLNH